ncbi:serpin family protein [Planktothrix sp. FACHB-1375]|uniref:Serpin family protein n=2 Tax=Aerosakkonema funiforme TaxID=1246630 RepID=A0A926ZFL3_9CYAN|nr:serpin family protein [Aerosakkonema funiforme FACHB-1375]
MADVSNTSFTKQARSMNNKLVAANTNFGFKLFGQIFRQNSRENIFVSPTSVAIALSMTYNGASGTTQQAMAQTLQLQGMSLNEINQSQLALINILQNPDPKVKLSIANSLWAKKDVIFKPDFLQKSKEFYKAQVTNLDFANPNSPSIINGWVNQNTNGKIPKIIDRINPDDILFLINAIYFKGSWTKEFPKNATQQRPFTLLNGTRKQHPLMSQTGRFGYYENQSFQAISLPYGTRRLSMYVFLPKQNINLQSFYNNLTAENWEQWMNQFVSRQGTIVLPRFKLEYEVTLNQALQALGMGMAFQDRANFSGMTAVPAKINQVKHKTFVEVNEEGTEAAAVTSVGVTATSVQIPQQEPFRMVVDRPFFCAIRDNQTGTILFMGSIVEPK